MDRQAQALELAGELLTDIELRRLKASEVVLKASRLARLVGHDELEQFLRFERAGYPPTAPAELIDRTGRRADDGKYYSASAVKLESNLDAAQRAVDAMRGGGNYSGDYASAAARNHDGAIANHANSSALAAGILGQVVASIYELVADIYHELQFSELQATLFSYAQERVDGVLAAAGGDALSKIERVSERLRDGDPESVSQALTTCRRLIDSTADYLFPPASDDYDAGDGAVLKVGPQQVLNRLQAAVHRAGAPKSRRDRLRRALSDLYGRCSAGTHAEVPVDEARFIFLQAYIVLGEVLLLSGGGEVPDPVVPT